MEHSALITKANMEFKIKDIGHCLEGYVEDDLLRTFEANDGSLVRSVVDELLDAAKEKQFKKRQARKAAATNFGNFAKFASDFVEAVTGPSDIIKGAIPMNLGSVVNGTLTLLLRVAAEKKVQDDLIAESLTKVTSWLRRLDHLKASFIRVPDKFEMLVRDIYDKLIDFLCICVRRLSGGRWKRVVVPTIRPTELKEAIDALKESVVDLFQEHSANQSLQITNLERKLTVMETHALDRDKADSRRRRNSAIIHTAKALKLPSDGLQDVMLDICGKAHQSLPKVKKITRDDYHKRIPLVWGGLQMLERRDTYQSWIEKRDPCLLLLSGRSHGTTDPQYSWLSPITSELYDRLSNDQSAHVLFFSGHQRSRQEPRLKERYAQILWGISVQALHLELDLTDDHLDDGLNTILKDVTRKAENPARNEEIDTSRRFGLIQEVLVAAIKLLHLKQPLYIILDGIVWMPKWQQEKQQEIPFQWLALQIVKLVLALRDEGTSSGSQSSEFPVKVLAVIKYDQWPGMATEWEQYMERAFPDRPIDLKECVIEDLSWHQEKA